MYHPSKTNIMVDTLSRVSMGKVQHKKDRKKELVKEVHHLAHLCVRLSGSSNSGVLVQNEVESS